MIGLWDGEIVFLVERRRVEWLGTSSATSFGNNTSTAP